MPTRLDKVIADLDVYERPTDVRRLEITNLTDKLDDVVPGSLFCCVIGATRDGHEFASEAVAKGAVALLVEREVDANVPQVRVPDVRAALGPAAAAFYDHPDRNLRVVGVTGTNGKTTTTNVLADILRRYKWKTATIGTLTGHFTSPPAIDLQRMLAELRDDHYQAVVMEVSSHALVQHRVDAIRFRAAVFTNLTQDHLDYHKTMSAYFEAKSLLFDPGRSEHSIVNIDDEWGRRLTERIAGPSQTYSLADVQNLEVGPEGSRFVWEGHQINLPLVGAFNVHNALGAAVAARALGVPSSVIAEGLDHAHPVPGRMEKVDRGQPFSVLVDFAHTPDGLENVLTVARSAAAQRKGQVIVVFGAGGDRDKEKRPLMGAVAERLADHIVVTTDNSRGEDQEVIASQITGGMQQPEKAHVHVDREKAIQMAIDHAHAGDVVVIAGKGHETTQDIGGVKRPFDDRLVAAAAIDAVRARLQAGHTHEHGGPSQ